MRFTRQEDAKILGGDISLYRTARMLKGGWQGTTLVTKDNGSDRETPHCGRAVGRGGAPRWEGADPMVLEKRCRDEDGLLDVVDGKDGDHVVQAHGFQRAERTPLRSRAACGEGAGPPRDPSAAGPP